jgi:two-component system cell cycle response regulator DivK
LLESQKYNITKATDGQAALKLLCEATFDLLILDIGLPKLSGIGLMAHMQKNNLPRPKTIVVSAYAMENEIRSAKMYGCEEYITKPVDIVKFLNAVQRALKGEEQ